MTMKKTLVTLCLLLLGMTAVLAQTLPDGVYYIRLAANPNYVIDLDHSNIADGTNIQLWAFNGSNAQKWNLRNHPNGTITLRSLCGRVSVIDLSQGRVVNGQNIHLWTFHSGINQYWVPTRVKGGYIIRSAVNKKYVIDNYYERAVNGNNIVLHEYKGSKAQIWKFQRIGPPVTNSSQPSRPATPPSQPVVTTPPPSQSVVTTPPPSQPTPPRTRRVRVVTGRCTVCNGTGLVYSGPLQHACAEHRHYEVYHWHSNSCTNSSCKMDCGNPPCNACGTGHCTSFSSHTQCRITNCERGDIVEYREEPY